MKISDAIESLQGFIGDGLTSTIAAIESNFAGLDGNGANSCLVDVSATHESLAAAAEIKRVSAQIDTTIHAIGILRCLPKMLEAGETIEYVSLGAGNTNRRFDLETDRRVAEFKFINWQGGSESVRQNGLFKDFSNLAEYETEKSRHMCVLGTRHPIAFLTRRRAVASVCQKYPDLLNLINEKYPTVSVVHQYYDIHSELSLIHI